MKRVLLSVSDKTGLIEFAKRLEKSGWEIISTGGSFKILSDEKINVKKVEDITGFKEIFDGRVKTLHPKIHGGILNRRDNLKDQDEKEEMGIEDIDMVVVNLYPFKETYMKENVTDEEIIENIDIGGPTLIRASAKNYKDVTIVTDVNDYNLVLEEIEKHENTLEITRLKLAKKAFEHTCIYDSLITDYFNKKLEEDYPDKLIMTFTKEKDLRYGENPHQKASIYISNLKDRGSNSYTQLNGKELSYNNISDIEKGINIINNFRTITAVNVKHGNPCGIGSGNSIEEAFKKAYTTDSTSVFGGIVVLNRKVTKELAKELKKIFLEIIVAPEFEEEGLSILKEKSKLILIKNHENPEKKKLEKTFISTKKGVLVQDEDVYKEELYKKLEVVTKIKPSKEEIEELLFAWNSVKGVNSNGIVISKNRQTIGLGIGQVSRIGSLEIAIRQGKNNIKNSVLASDGFFPFSDCVEIAAKTGIKAIIQPGGSKNDNESIIKANEYGLIMVFTGVRHFKH